MALAVIAGLVAAMFVALQSVSAVSAGACKDVGSTVLGLNDTCDITVVTGVAAIADPIDTDGAETADTAATLSGTADEIQSSDDRVATVTAAGLVTAVAYGTATITYNDYTAAVNDDPSTPGNEAVPASLVTKTYAVTVSKINISKIEFGSGTGTDFIADTDNVFAAGTDVVVRLTISSADANGGAITTIVSVPSTGLSMEITGGTSQRVTDTDTAVSTTAEVLSVTTTDFTLLTDGAPEGDYTVTATASQGADATLVTSAKATAKLSIGNAGNTVASATLALGLREGFNTPADATDDKPESGSVSAGGSINLMLTVLNGIGNPVNASDVAEIRVVAPFGEVTYLSGGTFTTDASNAIPGSALAKGSVLIKVASANDTPRPIAVHAIVLGKVSGVATTDGVDLSFTGDADAISIEDATKTLRNVNVEKDEDDNLVDDEITLLVSATDKAGNTASPPIGLGITITGPDGAGVSPDSIGASQPTQGKDGKWRITVTNKSGDSASTALKTGEYTLKAKAGSIEDSATFTVAGAATSVSVEVDNVAPTAYGTVTATAAVTDADGAAAADDTSVEFTSSNENVLKEVGDTSAKNTKDGGASQQFAVVGPGTALIIANVGNVSDVAVVVSTAGATEAAAEEVSLDCLSSLTGFSSYTCSMGSSASELFGMLSGRGATAIHLWNGSMWVRYAVVDGSEIPGSSDFTVTDGDNLYISN